MPETAVPPQVLSQMARRCPLVVSAAVTPPCLEPAPAVTPAATGMAWWFLCTLPLVAIGLAILLAVFVPAVVVGLVFFLPALAPFLLVGAGIALTGELPSRREES